MPSSRPQVLKMDTNEVVQSTSMTQVVYTGSNPENKKVVSYTSKSAVSRPATRGAPFRSPLACSPCVFFILFFFRSGAAKSE